jgi:hypothetical protein
MWLYGICSKIPLSFSHYLLIDCDVGTAHARNEILHWLRYHGIKRTELWKTPHGYHFVAYRPFRFEELVNLYPRIPHVDPSWLRIGLNRGYWFLWTRFPIFPPISKPVQYMRINVPEGNSWLDTKRLTGWMSCSSVKT